MSSYGDEEKETKTYVDYLLKVDVEKSVHDGVGEDR